MTARLRTGQWHHLTRPGLLLGASVLLATSLLATAHLATRTAIAQRQAEDLNASLTQVIPGDLYSNDPGTEAISISTGQGEISFFRAIRNDRVTAVAYSLTTTEGYGGAIRLLSGVDRNGVLLGVRVLSHSETPGLGDRMEITRSDWILSFSGRSLKNTAPEQWAVKKDGGQFDQFTGATITPRALVKAVRDGLLLFEKHRSVLLADSPSLAGTDSSSAEAGNHNGGNR